ncbi:TonB-dependent receptor domain-containing protein [Algoriphagus yeomjeoni]|uniref:Outer membrane receptor protein involved in Fe transport n=1 Tax=Algoriphagus yeomjeoni TaxID=291403 RepID=A0A327NUX1_9BACT|nr:TonB-dependent receptor [Algoriphagus yeomjeoni]RAI83855.1 outer membrane receptor protein involved in Fe transport [Algoriphagus yeomjeoni]
MNKLSFLLFIIVLGGPAFSQTGVKGKLIDQAENSPLEYASVAIYQTKDSLLITGAVTDQEGLFSLEDLKPGDYYLLAQFMGYESKTVSGVSITKNLLLDLGTILLTPDQQLLSEVEVSGRKFTIMNQVDRQVYNSENFLTSQGGTATDVLRNLPSVSINAQGELSVRGTTGFVVMINGKPSQASPEALLSQLPANAVDRIELVTSPSAKYDPEGKAGIINIIMKKGVTDGTFVQVNAKIGAPSIEPYDNKDNPHRYGADFTINHKKGKWDLSLGGNFQRNDISGRREGEVYTISGDTTTFFPSDGERSTVAKTYSGRFTLGFTPNEANDFSLGFYAGKKTADRTADILYYDNHAVVNEERLYTMQYYNENLRIRRGDFVLGSLDYKHIFQNKSQLSGSFLYEYTMLGGPTTNRNLGYPDTNIIYQDEYNTNDNPLHGTRLQVDYKSAPKPFGTLEFGYQYRYLNHTGDFVYERKNNETGVFELIPEFSSRVDLNRVLHSGYGQLTGRKGKWNYAAGARLEVMDRTLDLTDKAGTVDTTYLYDFVKLYPSASLQYAVSDELQFKTSYSRRVERTTTFKMNPFPEREHSETLEQGDPTLLPEFVDLVEIGVVKDFGDNSFSATTYFRNVQNLVNRVNTVYNDTILNRIYSNVGTGKSLGLEVGLELNPTDWWQIFAGTNVYHYSIEGEFDNRPINSESWIYSINANTSFDLGKNWEAQLAVNYLSPTNTAQGEDSSFLSPNLNLQKTFLDGRLSTTLQWLNIDMGLLPTNEQRITTWREGEFYTTTNYVYEVDMIQLNISYTFNKLTNKSRFIKSEFGEKEF